MPADLEALRAAAEAYLDLREKDAAALRAAGSKAEQHRFAEQACDAREHYHALLRDLTYPSGARTILALLRVVEAARPALSLLESSLRALCDLGIIWENQPLVEGVRNRDKIAAHLRAALAALEAKENADAH